MKQNGLKLSAVFILVNVTCSAVALLVLFLITSAAFQLGLLRPAPYMQVITLVLAGLFSGSLLSALAVKKVLAPFRRFSDESERIARGDFSIRCDTHSLILEVRQIARNLNAMVEELGTVETLREDFIAGVSHELKTPLTAIEGYAVLLGEPDITAAEQRQYTQEILDSSRRLSRMVSSILPLSSLDHCSELPGCREFSLDEQLRNACWNWSPTGPGSIWNWIWSCRRRAVPARRNCAGRSGRTSTPTPSNSRRTAVPSPPGSPPNRAG